MRRGPWSPGARWAQGSEAGRAVLALEGLPAFQQHHVNTKLQPRHCLEAHHLRSLAPHVCPPSGHPQSQTVAQSRPRVGGLKAAETQSEARGLSPPPNLPRRERGWRTPALQPAATPCPGHPLRFQGARLCHGELKAQGRDRLARRKPTWPKQKHKATAPHLARDPDRF